ncbi:MAG: hypothetical protein F4151_04475 [Gammaproteobacteria bacterium]|nr:hypothetical protein [Gammaproteobacteria bacterium]
MKEPFRPTGRISVSLLLALCFAVGCSEGGIERSPNDVPIFHGVVDLEIGEIEGEDPYLLTRIESIVEDARGRLIVADLQSHDVRIFGSEGDFLFRFGGQGEGPGELTQPCCLAFGPDGALWVREASRYSVFRLAGAGAEYDRGVRIAHGGVGMVAPVTFDTEGRLVDIGPVTTDDGPVVARFHHAPGGAVDTVPLADPERQATGSTTAERVIGESLVTFYVRQPFGPQWIHAHGPSGVWAEAVTSEYSVTLQHPDGTVSHVEGPQLTGPRLGPSERERARATIARDLRRLGLRNHPSGVPDRKPPLADIFFDRSGRLWVEKTSTEGDEVREADVYAESALVARYRWPRRVSVGSVPWVAESVLYGTTRDSLNVQRVARVRFEPGS